MGQTRSTTGLALAALAVIAITLAAVAGVQRGERDAAPRPAGLTDFLHDAPPVLDAEPDAAAPRFPTIINRPVGPPVVEVLQEDGTLATLSCGSCHSLREPDPTNIAPADLVDFHQDMEFVHGAIACLACHNAGDYDTLRLADGRAIDYVDVMTLCAQCHGPQARDYANGAHGGMSGHWDLSRGPRLRNGCTDCHDPHVPAFPRMMPQFKPIDRFLDGAHAGHDRSEAGHE